MVKLRLMEHNETIKNFMPPRAIDAISAGFYTISKHIYLILFPILFDLFLWFGPKLRIKALLEGNINSIYQLLAPFYQDSPTNLELFASLQEAITAFLNSFNLLSVTSTFPVGVPSFINQINSNSNPLGTVLNYEIQSNLQLLFVMICLLLVGIFIGTIFFRLIAQTNTTQSRKEIQFKTISNYFFNLLAYSIILAVAVFFITITTLFIASFFSLLNMAIGQFFFLSAIIILGWFFIPAVYAPVAIFVLNQNAFQSIISAYRIMGLRYRFPISKTNAIFTMPKSITFTLWVLVLYQGLNLVWQIPESSSWFNIFGIVGHAIISSSILSASFQYFQNLHQWQEKININFNKLSLSVDKNDG